MSGDSNPRANAVTESVHDHYGNEVAVTETGDMVSVTIHEGDMIGADLLLSRGQAKLLAATILDAAGEGGP